MYDISSRVRIGKNEDVHNVEIIGVFFYDKQNQMISIDIERQISLWDSAKFECLQIIKDHLTFPGYFSKAALIERDGSILACAKRMKIFEL